MGPENKPQYANVEQSFGAEPPIPHCPICGQAALEVVDETAQANPCDHLEFIFITEIGDFAFQSPECKAKFDAALSEDEDFWLADIEEDLAKVGYGNELLALSVTYGGMACGPVWHTDVYGFSYSRAEKKDK